MELYLALKIAGLYILVAWLPVIFTYRLRGSHPTGGLQCSGCH